LPKAIDMMRLRENEIVNTIELLSKKSKGFTKPKLVLIGGYALLLSFLFHGILEIAILFLEKRTAGTWMKSRTGLI